MLLFNLGNKVYIAIDSAVKREVRRFGIDLAQRRIINLNREEILRRGEEVRHLKAESGIAAEMGTHLVSVDINGAGGVHTLEFKPGFSLLALNYFGIGAFSAVICCLGTLSVKVVPGVRKIDRGFFAFLFKCPALIN